MATFKKITQSFTEMPDDLDGKHEVIVTIESMSTGVPNITAVMDAVFKDGKLVKFKFTDFYDAEGEDEADLNSTQIRELENIIKGAKIQDLFE